MRRETVSAIRFGYGLAPGQTPAVTSEDLIGAARKTTNQAPRISLRLRAEKVRAYRMSREDGDAARKAAQQELRAIALADGRHYLSLTVGDPGFGARLTSFWADHFTVAANGPLLRTLVPDFIEAAIRPHITGRFADMLRAATFHPAMLVYLNQVQSIGPNSRAGQRRGKGLNENLAREILELHTLGVDADYTQTDVRSFAELLTGLSADKGGFVFRPGISEPGPHNILGAIYGARISTLDHIEDALEDIALHPETAWHLARKLTAHFLGIDDQNLINSIADAYLAADGDLVAAYLVLLDDPRSWEPGFQKTKPPFDFIASALRAAGGTPKEIAKIKPNDLRQGIYGAAELMGQTVFRPPGPDGWSEDAGTWITPPGLAARIRWAKGFAERIEGTQDPRTFLETALGDAASPTLTFAVGGSESRVEGIALTLVSPEFNRR